MNISYHIFIDIQSKYYSFIVPFMMIPNPFKNYIIIYLFKYLNFIILYIGKINPARSDFNINNSFKEFKI